MARGLAAQGSDQRDDLLQSLESLNQAIRKINRTTRQRFIDTYHIINDKFKTVFPELFQGGRAELKLSDEENILLIEQRSEGTRPYSMVSIVDVRDKLQEDNLSKRKELYLRIQLWWKSNDHVRNGGNGKVQVFHMQENLRVLLKLLTDQDDNSVIMMAEIHRQLGEFGETKRLLNREFDIELNLIVGLIRDLADKKIRMVRELVYD